MLEEKATIIRIENAQTWVEVKGNNQGCQKCSQKQGCGTSILANLFKKEPQFYRVSNQIDAKQGEQVIIGIPENIFLKASFMGFIAPLLSMIFFAIIGHQLASLLHFKPTDLFAIGFGVVGLLVGLKTVTLYVEKKVKKNQYNPVILRKDSVLQV